MKKLLYVLCTVMALSCSSDADSSGGVPCYYNGHLLHRGPQGGCYYYNSSGDKVYVDRSYCNC